MKFSVGDKVRVKDSGDIGVITKIFQQKDSSLVMNKKGLFGKYKPVSADTIIYWVQFDAYSCGLLLEDFVSAE